MFLPRGFFDAVLGTAYLLLLLFLLLEKENNSTKKWTFSEHLAEISEIQNLSTKLVEFKAYPRLSKLL